MKSLTQQNHTSNLAPLTFFLAGAILVIVQLGCAPRFVNPAAFDAKPYHSSGLNYHENGEVDQAIVAYTQVIQVYPDYAEAFYNRGRAYYDKNQYTLAIVDLTKAIQLKPDYADAYYNRGWAHYGKDNDEEAIKDYTQAMELNPTHDADTYYGRGLAYYNRGY